MFILNFADCRNPCEEHFVDGERRMTGRMRACRQNSGGLYLCLILHSCLQKCLLPLLKVYFMAMHPGSTICVHISKIQTLSRLDWVSAHQKLQFVSLSVSSYLLHMPETIGRKLGHFQMIKSSTQQWELGFCYGSSGTVHCHLRRLQKPAPKGKTSVGC